MARVPQFVVGLVLISSMLAMSAQLYAQDDVLTREHHPWGRFQPGAWKEVRVVTQEFGPDGRLVQTVTGHTKTVLVRVDDGRVTLEVDSSVEMGCKELAGPRQTIVEDFYGVSIGEGEQGVVATPKKENVAIENEDYECQVRQVDTTDGNFRTTTTIHFSKRLPPYVLRAQRKTIDLAMDTASSEMTEQVVALYWPFQVLDRLYDVSLVRQITRSEKRTRRALIFTSPDVPGGVVAEMTKEVDPDGRTVRQSSLEVVAYGADDGLAGVEHQAAAAPSE